MGKEPEEEMKVVDRRLFDASGNLRESAREEGAAPAPAEKSAPPPHRPAAESAPPPRLSPKPPEPRDRQAARGAPPGEEGLEEVSLATFVMSLAVNALVALGEIPHPATQEAMVDLAGARQIIDILAMLREKTEGNRSAEETSILDGNLYELRMKYVERAKGA